MGHGWPEMVRGGERFAVVAVAVAVLCRLGAPSPALGQVPAAGDTATSRLTGTVFDRRSFTPVVGARVYLLEPSSLTRVATSESDAEGGFALPRMAAGRYGVRVERIGYRAVTDGVTLVGGEEENLAVYMVPEAIALEPLVVRVPRTAAYYMRDFERRRATGNGTFITRDQIERRSARQTSELLHSLGGVRVQYGSRGEASLFVRGTCRPQVYIDGAAIHGAVSIDMAVIPEDIEGMEVYSSAGIPAQYASLGACAAILVWTRPAVRGEGGKKVPLWKLIVTASVVLTLLILRH